MFFFTVFVSSCFYEALDFSAGAICLRWAAWRQGCLELSTPPSNEDTWRSMEYIEYHEGDWRSIYVNLMKEYDWVCEF